jgi:hypothetical protein
MDAAHVFSFFGAYEGVAFVSTFLCGTQGMRLKEAFPRRVLAAHIGPGLGSTWELRHMILGTKRREGQS